MWKQDKRAYIGLYGGLISLALLIIDGFVFGNRTTPYLSLFFFLAALFFLGLYLKGIKLGIVFIVGLIGICLIGELYVKFSDYIVDNGYISNSNSRILGFFVLIVLTLLVILILPKIMAKIPNGTDNFQKPINKETKKENFLDGTYVILIKPSEFKVDMVYKVFKKDCSLIFCRVGGQYYEINHQLLSEATPDKSEAQLLSEKNNFVIKREDIVNITVCKKQSYGRPNNGTIKFTLRSKKIKFLIHPSIEYEYLLDYFKNQDIKLTEQSCKYLIK
jgi:hypothetical protein